MKRNNNSYTANSDKMQRQERLKWYEEVDLDGEPRQNHRMSEWEKKKQGIWSVGYWLSACHFYFNLNFIFILSLSLWLLFYLCNVCDLRRYVCRHRYRCHHHHLQPTSSHSLSFDDIFVLLHAMSLTMIRIHTLYTHITYKYSLFTTATHSFTHSRVSAFRRYTRALINRWTKYIYYMYNPWTWIFYFFIFFFFT